ncbi:MAG: hypothetical protein ACFB4J_16950 [Elainellaceae cyanobacterium]
MFFFKTVELLPSPDTNLQESQRRRSPSIPLCAQLMLTIRLRFFTYSAGHFA